MSVLKTQWSQPFRLLSDESPPERPVGMPGERRQQDRRQADRQGKYDRRRNRCISCSHFQTATDSEPPGFCRFHQIAMAADAFACPYFSPQ